jgi:hypothetical protein
MFDSNKLNAHDHITTTLRNKKIYTAFSIYRYAQSLLVRVAALIVLIYSIRHYDENPVVISIVACLCIIFILTIGDDQITVYEDRIMLSSGSFWNLLFKSRKQVYVLSSIKSLTIEAKPESTPTEIGLAVIVNILLSTRAGRRSTNTNMFLILKDNTTITLTSDLEIEKLKKVVQLVHSLIEKNCH